LSIPFHEALLAGRHAGQSELTGADVRGSIVLAGAVFALVTEIKHVEQIADRRAANRT